MPNEAKRWEDMTDPEKIEALRRDLLKAYIAISAHDNRLDHQGSFVNDLQRRIEKGGL
jgi:hypothetical protein